MSVEPHPRPVGRRCGEGCRTRRWDPWVPVVRALLVHPSSEAPRAAPVALGWSRAWIRGCGPVGLRHVTTLTMAAELFPLPITDTEWRSEIVNSRNFDREIGHKNPR